MIWLIWSIKMKAEVAGKDDGHELERPGPARDVEETGARLDDIDDGNQRAIDDPERDPKGGLLDHLTCGSNGYIHFPP